MRNLRSIPLAVFLASALAASSWAQHGSFGHGGGFGHGGIGHAGGFAGGHFGAGHGGISHPGAFGGAHFDIGHTSGVVNLGHFPSLEHNLHHFGAPHHDFPYVGVFGHDLHAFPTFGHPLRYSLYYPLYYPSIFLGLSSGAVRYSQPSFIYPPTYPGPQGPVTGEYWLLALEDGLIRAVMDYWLENDVLYYVERDGTTGSVPLSELDLPFTTQFNRERGLIFRLPRPAR